MKNTLEFFPSKGCIRSPDHGFQYFAIRKDPSVNVLHSSFELWLFFVKFQGVLLLDQRATSLHFWTLKKIYGLGPTTYVKVSLYSKLTLCLPTSTYQWEMLSSVRPSGLLLGHRAKLIFSWDFPGGPVAKTPCPQCRGPGFNPWSGN